MTQQQRPPQRSERTSSRRTLRMYPRCRHRRPRSWNTTRNGDYVTISCLECGESGDEMYSRIPLQLEMMSNPKLDIEEPKLTIELRKYCDLRRRGYSIGAIRNRTGWPEYYVDLLLEEAMRRGMKGADADPRHAYRQWLLEMHDSRMDVVEIYRLSSHSEIETHEELTEAVETAQYAELERWTTLQENYAESDADWP